MDTDHDLLKTAEVAALCRVTPKTVWSWHRKGRLTAIELPGGELRFRRTDVEAVLSPVDPTEATA